MEVVPEPFLEEVFGGEVHEAEFAGGEHEKEMLETITSWRGFEVQPEVEDVGEEPPITPTTTKVGLSLGASHAAYVSAARRSTSSSRHYSRVKLVETTRNLVGFPSPYQLSYGNHPFFEGLYLLSPDAKAFYNNFLSVKGVIFEGCRIT